MAISQELKQNFKNFCLKEFPTKTFVANETSKTQWFLVHAGNSFDGDLHYEFYQNEVQLHIEIKKSELLQTYLFNNLNNSGFKWEHWRKPNHRCILKRVITNEDELFSAFCEIRDQFEPMIKEFEKHQIRIELDNKVINNVELYKKTLAEVFQLNYNWEENNIGENGIDVFKPLAFALSIPDYQRVYCWREKNVHQLLDDIINNGDKPFHLGSLILHKSKRTEKDVYAIVDGQQRLVTLALLLLYLQPEIELRLLDEKFESTEAQSYIAYNKTLIANFVTKNIEKLSIKKLLKDLQFSVLIINDGSLDLAYTFFSNQNSRGKSLTDYDLLKAHHLRFITIEKHATHLAERWDNIILNSDNDASDKDLGRTFGIYLFRLRKWMRKSEWSDDEKFKVKTEFEAAFTIPDIPPFGEQFEFYESIQGGSHFFAYADHFIYKFKTFTLTSEYKTLKNISGETHWWYKDVIESLLFAYYLKFGTIYLSEALFCIERIISAHRYGLGRSSLRIVLRYAGESEIIMMIDQATSPTFFLAEALQKINKLSITKDLNGIRLRYQKKIQSVYKEISETNTMTINKFIEFIK
jgi:uncharacterized protein with ParB-like and HNH nuclease domain